jgi:hypothetical protein
MDQDHGSRQDEAKKSARVVAALPPTSSSPSISSLLSKAQDLIVPCDYPLARKAMEEK